MVICLAACQACEAGGKIDLLAVTASQQRHFELQLTTTSCIFKLPVIKQILQKQEEINFT
jgi:hypothetical protein